MEIFTWCAIAAEDGPIFQALLMKDTIIKAGIDINKI